MSEKHPISFAFACVACILFAGFANAQLEKDPKQIAAPIDHNVLSVDQWKKVDQSVERGLAWLASEQQDDGSFRCIDSGQPAVTGLCLMAFLASGESPTDGRYSKTLTQAIDYIVSHQKRNGLIAALAPNSVPISREPVHEIYASCAITYNHAISSLALSEAYGQCDEAQAKKLSGAIEKAVSATLKMQAWAIRRPVEGGGWKYITKAFDEDSDLSATAWQLMFLRSAKNAGFDVPKENIDQAMDYVERCYNEETEVFVYQPKFLKTESRAMAGAGIVAMAHGGRHNSEKALKSGDWILTRDFTKYNADKAINGWTWQPDRFHYGVFHCSQAMYQLGGKYWKGFYPPVVETLLANQNEEGSWATEPHDKIYGNCYTTSLCILSLSVPNQLLPMFQR